MLLGVEGRTTLRFAVDLPASVVIGERKHACRIRSLSLGGLFVDVGASTPLAVGARAIVRFGSATKMIESRCLVRWRNDAGIGMQFEGMQTSEVFALSQLLRAAAREGNVAR